jgi:tetratricopeptide (TPR) repeat protein
MNACPPPDRWQDYVRDELSAEQEQALTVHVEACKECEERLAELVRPVQARSPEPSETPPDHLVERLCRLWPAFPPEDPTQEKYWPKIDGYVVLGVLGQGGMGLVYRAWEESLGRAVALKMIAAGGLLRVTDAVRLLNDARTAARLHHPGIVPIYGVGEHRGLPYCVMELIEGGTLASRVSDLIAAPQQAARLIAQVARALHYAHNEGTCHRDIKPANILLRVRRHALPCEDLDAAVNGVLPPQLETLDACVSDFGLARPIDESGLTPESNILGTPGYLAPEQVRLEKPSPAADVFALGAVLYECVTGRRPFHGATPLDTVLLTLQKEPERPRLLNSRLPRDLETVCLKCLEKEPRRRYASAGALADDLERWLRGEPVQARRVGPLGRVGRWCRRKPVIATMAGLLILAVTGGLVTSVLLWHRAVSGEAEALDNLERAETARQETEDSYARMSRILAESIERRLPLAPPEDPSPSDQEELLKAAERSLGFLVERRSPDRGVQEFYARVVLQLGAFHLLRQRDAAQPVLEKAASLWREVLAEEPGKVANQAWYAMCFFLLEQVHDRAGHADRAQEMFDKGYRVWEALTREPTRGLDRNVLARADLEFGWVLVNRSYSGKEVADRLQTIRRRLHRVAGTAKGEVFFDLMQVGYWHCEAQQQKPSGPPFATLPATQEAASILSRLLSRTDLEENLRLHVAGIAFLLSMDLRRGQAAEQGLRLCQQANGTLQELLTRASDKGPILDALNDSWFEISKVHWELGRTEETLTACRNAVQAARAAYLLDPSVPGREYFVADRYLRLGRKLCELGRLDEAEACFRERQALWPGDTARQAELVQKVRWWAGQVGNDEKNLSPDKQQERERYLDLAARLERNGAAMPSTSRAGRP